MISQINSSMVANAYVSNENKASAQKLNISKQGDMSKVDRLKESVDAGTYKIDIQALSKKIAEELL
jgi:anti-sigma28 factor (negative regulator of flagellin synthesis)